MLTKQVTRIAVTLWRAWGWQLGQLNREHGGCRAGTAQWKEATSWSQVWADGRWIHRVDRQTQAVPLCQKYFPDTQSPKPPRHSELSGLSLSGHVSYLAIFGHGGKAGTQCVELTLQSGANRNGRGSYQTTEKDASPAPDLTGVLGQPGLSKSKTGTSGNLDAPALREPGDPPEGSKTG